MNLLRVRGEHLYLRAARPRVPATVHLYLGTAGSAVEAVTGNTVCVGVAARESG